MRLGLLNDRNDLEIGRLGDWLPDESDYSTAVRLRKGVGVIGGREFFTPMGRMDGMGFFGMDKGDKGDKGDWIFGGWIPACAGMTVWG